MGIENEMGLRPVCQNCGGSVVSLIGTKELVCLNCHAHFDMVQKNA